MRVKSNVYNEVNNNLILFKEVITMTKIEIENNKVRVTNIDINMYIEYRPIENGNYYANLTGVIYESIKMNELVSLIVGVING